MKKNAHIRRIFETRPKAEKWLIRSNQLTEEVARRIQIDLNGLPEEEAQAMFDNIMGVLQVNGSEMKSYEDLMAELGIKPVLAEDEYGANGPATGTHGQEPPIRDIPNERATTAADLQNAIDDFLAMVDSGIDSVDVAVDTLRPYGSV